MPIFPTLQDTPVYTRVVDVFNGLNRNLRAAESEFEDMENMTSTYYPVLSPRGKRGVYASPSSAQGLIEKDALCYVDGADFVVNATHINMNLSTAAADCPKTLISMGAYVLIFPDKKYINTKDLTDYGAIEANTTTTTTVSFSLCTVEGSEYGSVPASAEAPANPSNMDYWIDTSSTPNTLKQWSSQSSVWTSVATTYVKISATGIGTAFSAYDGVEISGITPATCTQLNGSQVIYARGDDYIVIVGIIPSTVQQSDAVTVTRFMPYMDFVCESGNRLWGCRYGTARNGEVVNEIYASKLGDFRNWNCYLGISTDSYTASLGTDGQFTGAITHLGYPCFFKQNSLHKIYGTIPSNFQVQTTTLRGVEKGSERSLAIVNEVLYYKGVSGIMAYDGSLPTEMSKAIGEYQFSDAVGGAFGGKYYVSMKDSSNQWHLYVYDSSRGMWHKEDSTHAMCFCACRDDLYFINVSDGKIYSVNGSGTLESTAVPWMAETGVISIYESSSSYRDRMEEQKYINRIVARLSLESGSKLSFYIQYDSLGDWEYLFTVNATSLRTFSIPIRPRRCDHFKLRLVGTGGAKLFSWVLHIERGSDGP